MVTKEGGKSEKLLDDEWKWDPPSELKKKKEKWEILGQEIEVKKYGLLDPTGEKTEGDKNKTFFGLKLKSTQTWTKSDKISTHKECNERHQLEPDWLTKRQVN